MNREFNEFQVRDPFVDPLLHERLAGIKVPRKALFLDRDGVINVDLGYVHHSSRTIFIPGIFKFVEQALDLDYLPIVVTNQAGIARGYYSEQDFLDYTAWIHDVFRGRGAPLAATFYCPHHAEAGRGPLRIQCACRKPSPGMILAAATRFDIDLPASLLMGDKPSDIEAALTAGILHTHLSVEGNAYACLTA